MDNAFYDRRGRQKFGGDVVPVRKKGYFAVLVKSGKVLLTYPSNTNVPEFPGGSMCRDEDFRQCLLRKLYEETGIDFMLDKGEKQFHQVFNFFDETECAFGVFYIYDQTFILYDASSYGFDSTAEKWRTPENSMAAWVSLEDIVSGKVKINYAHWQAVKALFLQKEA